MGKMKVTPITKTSRTGIQGKIPRKTDNPRQPDRLKGTGIGPLNRGGAKQSKFKVPH